MKILWIAVLCAIMAPVPAHAISRGVIREVINKNFDLGSHKLKNPKQECLATAPSVSDTDECRTYCNSADDKLYRSCNGGAYAEFGAGSGATSGGTVTQVDTDAVTDETFCRYDGTTGNVCQDSQTTETDAGDVTIAGSLTTGKAACNTNTDCNAIVGHENDGTGTPGCSDPKFTDTYGFTDIAAADGTVDTVFCEDGVQILDMSNTGAVPGTDSVGTVQLNDGTDNTPVIGECVKVAADTSEVAYMPCVADGAITSARILDGAVSSDDLAPANEIFTLPLFRLTPGVENFLSIDRAPTGQNRTITEVWCETDTGTADIELQIDDGTPADVMGADLQCTTSGASDSTSLTGDWDATWTLDYHITATASTPGKLSLIVSYTIDE